MAGINFNDLPKNLQAKLQPFITVAGTVENAIEQAKLNGKWTEADTELVNSLNGGMNWGKTTDEFAFKYSNAGGQKHMAANNNSKPKVKQINLNRGPSQAELDKKRADLQRSIVEKRSQGFMGYLSAMVDRVKLDMTPEKEGQQVAGGPARFLIAAAVAAVMVACTDDITQTQNVTIPMRDYSKQLDAIIGRLDKLENQHAQQFKALLEELNLIIQNQNVNQKQLDAMYEKIKSFLQQIVDNQIEIQTDNNKNAAQILAVLVEIMNSSKSMEEKLADVMALLKQIKSVGESIDNTTKEILEEIKNAKNDIINTLNTNNKAVLDAIAGLNENQQQSLDILNEIKALIVKYGTEGNTLSQAILVAIGKINDGSTDLSGIEALLKQLVNGQKQTNAEVANLTDVFNKFSSSTAAQLNTIISKLDKSSPNYQAQLNTIIKLLEQLDANNDARNKKVLDAINKLGANVTADLTAILNKINNGGSTGPDYSAVLDAILKKLGDMQKDNNNNFAAVLKAIGNIDIKPQDLSWIKDHLDAILEAIKNHDVIVKVEGGKCTCCDGNGVIHEGVLGDLNQLLG